MKDFVWTAALLTVAGFWADTADFEALPEGRLQQSGAQGGEEAWFTALTGDGAAPQWEVRRVYERAIITDGERLFEVEDGTSPQPGRLASGRKPTA